MNTKEIGEIRRRQRRDRSNMTAIHGCYVSEQKEIISHFSRSTGMMSENEADKYFGLLRRSLGGTLGKNLLEVFLIRLYRHTGQVGAVGAEGVGRADEAGLLNDDRVALVDQTLGSKLNALLTAGNDDQSITVADVVLFLEACADGVAQGRMSLGDAVL